MMRPLSTQNSKRSSFDFSSRNIKLLSRDSQSDVQFISLSSCKNSKSRSHQSSCKSQVSNGGYLQEKSEGFSFPLKDGFSQIINTQNCAINSKELRKESKGTEERGQFMRSNKTQQRSSSVSCLNEAASRQTAVEADSNLPQIRRISTSVEDLIQEKDNLISHLKLELKESQYALGRVKEKNKELKEQVGSSCAPHQPIIIQRSGEVQGSLQLREELEWRRQNDSNSQEMIAELMQVNENLSMTVLLLEQQLKRSQSQQKYSQPKPNSRDNIADFTINSAQQSQSSTKQTTKEVANSPALESTRKPQLEGKQNLRPSDSDSKSFQKTPVQQGRPNKNRSRQNSPFKLKNRFVSSIERNRKSKSGEQSFYNLTSNLGLCLQQPEESIGRKDCRKQKRIYI